MAKGAVAVSGFLTSEQNHWSRHDISTKPPPPGAVRFYSVDGQQGICSDRQVRFDGLDFVFSLN
jgi:hypothetical protein